MAEIETTKKRHNKFTEIMKTVATVGGGVMGGGGVGPVILWGGGLVVATAITAFSIRINKKNRSQQSRGKVKGAAKSHISVDTGKRLNRGIEEGCINGFRLALHNPSPPLHHHAWSSFSLSKMEVEGQEFVSTRYLISEEKIVLLVEWRHETAACSKEEIVIFDNLQSRKNASCDDHPTINLEQSALKMLSVSADDFTGTDPLGTFIRSFKDNRKAFEHLVSGKMALGGGGEDQEDGKQENYHSESIEESSTEEIEIGRDGYGEDASKETGEDGSALIPKVMGTAKAGILQQTIYKMRMQIWVLLVAAVMLILLASPKLLSD